MLLERVDDALAEELYCHRNTVIYRTKQIEQLTGCTLTDPRDKLMLELALMTVEPEPQAGDQAAQPAKRP